MSCSAVCLPGSCTTPRGGQQPAAEKRKDCNLLPVTGSVCDAVRLAISAGKSGMDLLDNWRPCTGPGFCQAAHKAPLGRPGTCSGLLHAELVCGVRQGIWLDWVCSVILQQVVLRRAVHEHGNTAACQPALLC